MREYIAHGHQQYDLSSNANLFCYPLAKRLWEAGGNNDELEMYMEIRRVGYLLSKSIDKMRFHYYLIQHIICGKGVFPEERECYGLPYAPVSGYANAMEQMWNRIGDWLN